MASILKVDKLDPQSGTALEIGTSGDTVTVPSGATLDISSATLTPPATLPASSGVNLTALNATNLGSGTVPTARLGTGTASSSTVLYGDQTYKAEPGGGKLLQAVMANTTGSTTTTGIDYVTTDLTATITPASSSNKVLVLISMGAHIQNSGTLAYPQFSLRRDTNTELAYKTLSIRADGATSVQSGHVTVFTYLDSPSTTSATTYTIQVATDGGADVDFADGGSQCMITVMEVLA